MSAGNVQCSFCSENTGFYGAVGHRKRVHGKLLLGLLHFKVRQFLLHMGNDEPANIGGYRTLHTGNEAILNADP